MSQSPQEKRKSLPDFHPPPCICVADRFHNNLEFALISPCGYTDGQRRK